MIGINDFGAGCQLGTLQDTSCTESVYGGFNQLASSLKSKYPDYIPAYEKAMSSTKAHMFNMFIIKKELADKYCEWLFDILFELEKEIDTSGMSTFDARLFGRVSELLFNVWLLKNNIKYTEINHIHMEPIDWTKKISGFLSAKFLGKKYSKSF